MGVCFPPGAPSRLNFCASLGRQGPEGGDTARESAPLESELVAPHGPAAIRVDGSRLLVAPPAVREPAPFKASGPGPARVE